MKSESFIGRVYSDDEKNQAGQAIKHFKEEASIPIEEELEKTDFELRMIELTNDLLNRELSTLGLDQVVTIGSE